MSFTWAGARKSLLPPSPTPAWLLAFIIVRAFVVSLSPKRASSHAALFSNEICVASRWTRVVELGWMKLSLLSSSPWNESGRSFFFSTENLSWIILATMNFVPMNFRPWKFSPSRFIRRFASWRNELIDWKSMEYEDLILSRPWLPESK